MYKIIIASILVLSILAINFFNNAKNMIETRQEKHEKIYAELGIKF